MKPRKRFSRSIIASSDAYKYHSHRRILEENHVANVDYFNHINATVVVDSKEVESIIKKNYFTKCFGKLIRISEDEAKKLGSELVIIM